MKPLVVGSMVLLLVTLGWGDRGWGEETQEPRCPFHKFAASQAAARLYGLGG